MAISIHQPDEHDRDAVNLLIKAIEAQPEKDNTELATSVRVLRQYLDAPSHRLFSLAKIAFDDIDPAVKKAIRKVAVGIARESASTERTRISLKSIASTLSGDTTIEQKKKQRFATPFLAALQRGGR